LSKRIFRKIDEEEEKRIDGIWERVEKAETEKVTFSLTEVFDSETTGKILGERPLSIIESFHKGEVVLPVNCLLFPRTLVIICPECDCNKDSELIKPYLEREMIVPVLSYPLQDYRTDFADLIIQYPYVGTRTFSFLREIKSQNEGEICEHCFNERRDGILEILSKISADKKLLDEIREYLEDRVFPNLFPALDHERQILKELENVVSQGNLEPLPSLGRKSGVLRKLRAAQAFNAVPEVGRRDLSNISENAQRMGVLSDPEIIEQIEGKKLALRALNIDYNPKAPVEDYLDVILPRRKKINSLLNELMSSENEEAQMKRMNDEIWRINEEISSSKALETLTFLTNFVSDNAKILFGMLVGGLVGYYSASFTGCTVGSISGLAGGIISKHLPLKTPEYPRKTLEWLKAKIESPEERLLSIMLSKDVKTIQTWRLRKRLRES